MTRREDKEPDSGSRTGTPSRPLGVPLICLDKAVSLHGSIEDDELVRRLSLGTDPRMRGGS